MKKKLFVLGLLFVACIALIGCGGSSNEESYEEQESEKFEEIAKSDLEWPTSEVAKLLPIPESTKGRVEWEYDDSFFAYVANTSREQYDLYVDACSAAGFNINSSGNEMNYYADNSGGMHVSLSYDAENEIMSVKLAPVSEEALESTEESTVDSSSGEVTPEFKEAMDSYEQFFQEYVDFMETYNNSDDPTSLMGEYNDYMKQYTDTMAKLDDIDEDSLSEADKQYYVEVSTRISSMLTDSLGDML